jgi:hypothetical protein
MPQTIALSAGAVEYTHPLTITETTGKDISGATIRMSLGTYTTPGDWSTPDTDTSPTPASRTVSLLIGDTRQPEAGDYWLWTIITDTPEIVPRRHDKLTIT